MRGESIKLLLDEHIWVGLREALAQRGYDVIHLNDTGQRGIDDEPLLVEVVRRVLEKDHEVVIVMEAREALTVLGAVPGFDLVLCDPPYRLADRLANALDPLIRRVLAGGGRVVVESSPDRPLPLSLPLLTERHYGDTLVRVHSAEEGK